MLPKPEANFRHFKPTLTGGRWYEKPVCVVSSGLLGAENRNKCVWWRVCKCVYWKVGSMFRTTLVIGSSFAGLAGTKVNKKNARQPRKFFKRASNGNKRLRQDLGTTKQDDRKRRVPENVAKPKWAAFVHSADISGEAGCRSCVRGSGPFTPAARRQSC